MRYLLGFLGIIVSVSLLAEDPIQQGQGQQQQQQQQGGIAFFVYKDGKQLDPKGKETQLISQLRTTKKDVPELAHDESGNIYLAGDELVIDFVSDIAPYSPVPEPKQTELRNELRALALKVLTRDTFLTSLNNGFPGGRYGHSTVWTGSQLILFGGNDSSHGYHDRSDGAIYSPRFSGKKWTPLPEAPTSRASHSAVWVPQKESMLVWGGRSTKGGILGDGLIFKLPTQSWETFSIAEEEAPTERFGHSAVFTGTEMIVFGGCGYGTPERCNGYLKDGGIYNVETGRWTRLSLKGTPPTRRYGHSAVWTGTQMIVFGGYGFRSKVAPPPATAPAPDADQSQQQLQQQKPQHPTHVEDFSELPIPLSDLYIYDGPSQTWSRATESSGIIGPGRFNHSAVWADFKIGARQIQGMFVFGGRFDDRKTTQRDPDSAAEGKIYFPKANEWRAIRLSKVGRAEHSALWTGSKMIVLGGYSHYEIDRQVNLCIVRSNYMSSADIYDPVINLWQER